MTQPLGRDRRLEILSSEIERWNQQINLVSRVNPRERVAALVAQCQVGWRLVATALADKGWLENAAYIDLGSGAGLPGLVWATARGDGPPAPISILVEPRDKRAWFLRRTARLMGLDGVSVLSCRWGDGEISLSTSRVLVSMKALRLTDAEVLDGLGRYDSIGHSSSVDYRPREIGIVRFLDPEEHTQEWLEETFAALDPDGGVSWRRIRVETLGDGDPRLLLTQYRAI